ncbi:polysaccharide deacetylase family protein [Streptomyces sp. 8N616]|uniref:polysaccharide deacetylase family protein n=1 Tax=Streptomyces sp. 8N616 TaxID=3457414 RepID=UPI003FD41AC0
MIQNLAHRPVLRARRRTAPVAPLLTPLLALALAACGGSEGGGGRGEPASPSVRETAVHGRGPDKAGPAAGAPAAPTLPAKDGRTPVFSHGARDGGKLVALTFAADMAPEHGTRAAGGERFDNPRLVASLRRMRVPATIFMTGRWADEYPDQARSLGRDPLFEVGNHSYSHGSFSDSTSCRGLRPVSPDAMRAEVDRAFAAIRRAGVPDPVPYFRFPGGCFDDRALRAVTPAGVTAVQGDVVSGDASADTADEVAERVLARVKPGSVVVMHATLSRAPGTDAAVRRIVPELRARGYRFVRVSELIGTGRGQDRDQGEDRGQGQ